MNDIQKCPLCGGKTISGLCMECDYVIPDSDELEYMTLLANTEPEDYPTAEAARNELLSDVKVRETTDLMADVHDPPPVMPKRANTKYALKVPERTKSSYELLSEWFYDHYYIKYIVLILLLLILPDFLCIGLGFSMLIPFFKMISYAYGNDSDSSDSSKLKLGIILLLAGIIKANLFK